MNSFLIKIISLIISGVMLLSGVIFNPAPDDRETFLEKAGGFVCGVCHPNENYRQIYDANIGWVRFDIPFPYNSDGSLSNEYLSFKQRAQSYTDNGFKVMAITPYPSSYISYGLDPRLPENDEKIKETAVFLCNDLRSCISGLHITNEMGVDIFTYPLTLEEAAHFVAIQLEAVYDVKGDILLGYNSSGMSLDYHKMLVDYAHYCDYIGLDIYVGCFGNSKGTLRDYKNKILKIYRLTKRPIMLQEFGYISSGEPKSDAQRVEVLESYGYSSEEEARADIENLVSKLPQEFQNNINIESDYDKSRWADVVFGEYKYHFYCELGKKTRCGNYEHTEEGQAEFFSDAIKYIYKLNCVTGMFVYCYSDSPKCYQCGQNDCPVETSWGLVNCNGEPKKSYYAVQEAYGNIKSLS